MRSAETVADPSAFELLGEGSRRRCYRLPDRDACVKFYRRPSEYTHKTTLGVRLHIWLARHCPTFNVCCHEWRYHCALRRRLPAELFSVFPESLEPVYSPSYGWGVAESLLLNHDGSPMRRVIAEITLRADPALRRRLLDAAERLFSQLADHAVCFYDPPNVMVQWTGPGTFRLRVVDFEPKGRALIPGLSHIRPYVRQKVRRRCERYLARLRAAAVAEPLTRTAAAAAGRVRTQEEPAR